MHCPERVGAAEHPRAGQARAARPAFQASPTCFVRAAGFRVEYVRRGLVIGARDPASPTRTALDSVMYTELISATDMREYFPAVDCTGSDSPGFPNP
jgi:hypothetical protein